MWLQSSPPPRELPMPKFDLIPPPPPLIMENFARRPIAPASPVRPSSGTFVPAVEPEQIEPEIRTRNRPIPTPRPRTRRRRAGSRARRPSLRSKCCRSRTIRSTSISCRSW
jgi:hypothetical protein